MLLPGATNIRLSDYPGAEARKSDSNQQLTLFSALELKAIAKKSFKSEEQLQMLAVHLQNWKTQIHKHQHQIRVCQLAEQATLFDLDSLEIGPETIDPFSLTLYSFSFFRLPAFEPGNACIYFVGLLNRSASVLSGSVQITSSNREQERPANLLAAYLPAKQLLGTVAAQANSAIAVEALFGTRSNYALRKCFFGEISTPEAER